MNLFPPSRRIVWFLGVVALGVATPLAGVLFSNSLAPAPSPAPEARTVPASAGGAGVICFGRVDLAHGVTSLYSLQPGRVAAVLVEENQEVPAGAVLLRLEDGLARGRLAEAEAALEGAGLQLAQARKAPEIHHGRIVQQQAAVEAMRYRLSAARLAHQRKVELAQSLLLDANEVAISVVQLKELEALERGEVQRLTDLQAQDPQDDIRRAEREAAGIQARVQQARHGLEECTLKAPMAGVVLRMLVGPGDVLSGMQQQPAVLFAGNGPQVIRAEVEQEFAGRVAVGQAAVLQDEAESRTTWRGQVKRIANWYSQRRAVLHEPFQLHDVRTVECLITLNPGEPPLRIGQRVRVLLGPLPPQSTP